MRISDWSSDVCSSDLRLGYPDGSRGRTGLVVAVGFGSYFGPVAILPANVPNNVVLGAAEVFYGVQLQYFDWLLIHFPVLGLLKSALLVLVRSEEHTSELQSLMRNSYAVFCLNKTNTCNIK